MSRGDSATAGAARPGDPAGPGRARPLLEVAELHAGYGRSAVLFGVSFAIGAGEVLTLLGRNGMGKTTTVRAIMGLLRPSRGRVLLRGAPQEGRPSHLIARAGIGLVPEGRQIFPNLTVEENLIATARGRGRSDAWTLTRIYQLFGQLRERRRHLGNQLSGGEQQMLAIGRALLTNPDLLILDEATEGLAPLIRAEIWRCLALLKAEGQSILLIDKHLAPLLELADRHVILEKGRVVWQGDSAALAAAPEVQHTYLGV